VLDTQQLSGALLRRQPVRDPVTFTIGRHDVRGWSTWTGSGCCSTSTTATGSRKPLDDPYSD